MRSRSCVLAYVEETAEWWVVTTKYLMKNNSFEQTFFNFQRNLFLHTRYMYSRPISCMSQEQSTARSARVVFRTNIICSSLVTTATAVSRIQCLSLFYGHKSAFICSITSSSIGGFPRWRGLIPAMFWLTIYSYLTLLRWVDLRKRKNHKSHCV